ncbi:hypothetical protein [Nonomuraea lactucae]|uniref:hypothetical protein n=1 Tax=Nonomuraea lactucae TaxID=2249762 RepID=UPI000DE1B4E4|nr:hypothetical protein [Nonomuraea lactucae]
MEAAQPVVLAIQVTPEPVVLDANPVEVIVEASTEDATSARGWLTAPDGSRTELDFAEQQAPCDRRAVHTFRQGDQAGDWSVTVDAGGARAAHGFMVEIRGAKPATRFASFEARPAEVTRGDPVTFTGRLERERGGTWAPAGGQSVVITFQEENTCGWRIFADAVTDDLGVFRARALAPESGHWRAEFRGTAALMGDPRGGGSGTR